MATPSTSRPGPRATPARHAVVSRAEVYLGASAGPLRVTTLCRLVGLSERALRNAILGVHGVGPARWMRARRLDAARAQLETVHATPTVTAAATEQGFYQLGRFAGMYKAAFGEHPSQTLRRRVARARQTGRCQ
jgi:transcriptional regulator GlxA family with amidase domain